MQHLLMTTGAIGMRYGSHHDAIRLLGVVVHWLLVPLEAGLGAVGLPVGRGPGRLDHLERRLAGATRHDARPHPVRRHTRRRSGHLSPGGVRACGRPPGVRATARRWWRRPVRGTSVAATTEPSQRAAAPQSSSAPTPVARVPAEGRAKQAPDDRQGMQQGRRTPRRADEIRSRRPPAGRRAKKARSQPSSSPSSTSTPCAVTSNSTISRTSTTGSNSSANAATLDTTATAAAIACTQATGLPESGRRGLGSKERSAVDRRRRHAQVVTERGCRQPWIRFTPPTVRTGTACSRRDAAADGLFWYSVATTGVYCRPSCPSRQARRENVAFHATPQAARRAGFRPCRRCDPDAPRAQARHARLVADACRTIEQAEAPPPLGHLAALAGMSPSHFHRLFRAATGLTPKAYAEARRAVRVREALAGGSPVTAAIYAAGFGSSGRFYAAADAILGMTPSPLP